MLNKREPFFYKNLLFTAIVLMIFGCASQQLPHGGPKDVTPPRLLKATPPNMTRHFAAKTVRLDFDEYFKLNNQFTEITMSPVQDKQPEFKIKDKSLVINFKDTLQKNTTYVINFGKAIQDVNEGNTLKNFTYVFSTGPHIDSLSVSGNVTNSITQQREKDVTIMLFPLDKDSVYFGKKKPTIYATTDTAGNFSLNNLHDGDYTIYALKENSPDRIYDKDDELIAFLKKPIRLYSDTSDIKLSLFQQDPQKFRMVENKFEQDGKLLMVFNKKLINPSIKVIYPPALDNLKIVEFSKTNDTARLYMKNMDFDSLRVAIIENGKPIDSISKDKGRKETFKKDFTFALSSGASNKLKPFTDLLITSTAPIDNVDEAQITLSEDSTSVPFNLVKDTSGTRKFSIKYHWKQDAKYIIDFEPGAFTSIYGQKNIKFIKSFAIDKVENYSTLTLHVTVPDTSKQYIVQFYQDNRNILNSYPISKNGNIVYKNYLTGKYHIRVIYDSNRNGKWDTGNVKKKLYPENIWIDPTEITLRPNWDAEDKLEIPREVVIP